MKIQKIERKRTEMISSLKLIYILFAEEMFLVSKNFKTSALGPKKTWVCTQSDFAL